MTGAIAALLAVLGGLVTGGGRRPYGGAVELAVRDAGALVDPHVASDRGGRLLAALGHCHVFRPVLATDGAARIDIVPELAQGLGSFNDGTLMVTLADGARFHDGAAVTPADVVASWKRLATVGPLKGLAAQVRVSEVGPRAVAFAFGRGAAVDEAMALLARPEAAILHGGRAAPGAGCGPFMVTSEGGGRIVLQAFAGHPEGRPWLAEVHVKVRADADAALPTAFRYGEVDLAWEPVPGAPAATTALGGGWASWVAIVRPGLRGADRLPLRRRMMALMRDARLARYVEGRALAAGSLWPDALSPAAGAALPVDASPVAAGAESPLTGLVIAYPDGDDELAELARALRDALRALANDNARVVAVARLGAASAAAQSDPIWDLAVVRHEWSALTRDEAALELADVFGLGPPAASEVLSGQTRRWAEAAVARLEVLPLVHAPRGALVKGQLRGVDAPAGVPGLGDGWRPRPPGAAP